jgi:transcriptional regulator with XRE-family HTH domain
MTKAQAQQLGKLIARTRERKNLTYRHLAGEIGADPTWIVRLERGEFASPAPERLARLAEVLDIDPERIDRIAGRHLSKSLPGMRTYFRALHSDLSDADIEKVEALVAELHDEQGGKRGTKR